MNKLETYKQYRTNLNQIQGGNRCGSHVNCVRLNSHSTKKHEETKFIVCWILLQEGYDFITEGIWLSGLRADVFDIQRNIAFEILCSETEAECDLKGYPVPIIKVKAGMSYEEIKKLIL